jgi:hypothetical protein
MSKRVSIGETVRQETAKRRPAGLELGALHVCAGHGHVWLSCWHLDGEPWCEACWWNSQEGEGLVLDLVHLTRGARSPEETGS